MTGRQSVTWINNLTKRDIEEYAERGVEVSLGNVYSGSAQLDVDKERIADTLDGLLRVFGVEVTDWQDRIMAAKGTVTSPIGAVGDMEYDKRDVRRSAASKRIGDFVMDCAWQAVPLESDEDQTGEFELTLQLDPGVSVTIKGFGEQEVYRDYLDPSTGQKLVGEIEELEEMAMLGEAITDFAAVHTNISYGVAFSNNTPDSV